MGDLFTTVRDLKDKAKNRRDLGRYERGVKLMEQAISGLQDELASTEAPDWRSRINAELADCHGLTAGIYRRWALETEDTEPRRERMLESIRAYDRGYEFERVNAEQFGSENSYNLVNRILSRILYAPHSLEPPGATLEVDGAEPLNVPEALTHAESSIGQQLQLKRRGDMWAMADLALVSLLEGKSDGESAYRDFELAEPPGYAYESALSTLLPLSELDIPAAAELLRAVAKLKQAAARMRG